MRRIIRILCFGLLLLSTGCSSLEQFLYTPTPGPTTQATSTPELVPITTPAEGETPQPTIEGASTAGVLRVWLPPQFDPEAGTASANLLRQRLNLFEAQHPGLEIEVRIKAVDGDADLLDALSAASIAAPNALPDLIALSHADMEAAAEKGLLHPIDKTSASSEDADWYEYANQLATFENTTYGLPFAGDALILLYRPELVWIKTWDDILLSKASFVFAGADPQALTMLSLYVSAGGTLTDDQGKPTLDEETLNRVLELFANGRAANLFINADSTLASEEQVLQEYRARHANLAIIHTSTPLESADGLTQPLMGLDEAPMSFATSWMWALAGQNAEKQQLAHELAVYLVEDDFLNPWTRDMGYLPVRPSAVSEDDAVTKAIIESIQPVPSADVLSVLGPLMEDALVRVLNGEQHDVVAKETVEKLK